MDSATYTALTGKTAGDANMFKLQSRLAKKTLERMLGYPLCPDDWDNQYLEIGKTRDDWSGPDVDTSTLEAPDTVVESYRFFTWNPRDEFLAIDPAIKVHNVKLVKTGVYDQGNSEYNGFTFKTFEADEYRLQMVNDCDTPYSKWLRVHGSWLKRYPIRWSWPSSWFYQDELLQVAVDAEWAFDELPLELKKAWADLIGNYSNQAASTVDKGDIKSESIGSYSYSRFDGNSTLPSRVNSMSLTAYEEMFKDFAGPRGSLEKAVVL